MPHKILLKWPHLPGDTSITYSFQRQKRYAFMRICYLSLVKPGNVSEYGNCNCQSSDLRDDGGNLQRLLGGKMLPFEVPARVIGGWVGDGSRRGSLQAGAENQPAHVADVARRAAYRAYLLQINRRF